MKNIFKKIGLAIVTMTLGVFNANAEEYTPTISVDPVQVVPGSEIEIPVVYESTTTYVGFQMDIVLPEGLTFELMGDDSHVVSGDAVTDHIPNELLKTIPVEGQDKETQSLRVLFFSMKNSALKNGTLFTFKVKADEKLADLSQIKLDKIIFSEGEVGCPYFDYSFDVKNIKKQWDANEAANEQFNAAFMEVTKQLDAADAKINEECPDVKDTYLNQLAEIVGQANKLGMEISELYAGIELTQEKADEAVAALKELSAKIDAIVAAAVEAQNNITTGINGISADVQNAEAVYSVGGVRLNKAAKGVNIVIKNGKAIKVVK